MRAQLEISSLEYLVEDIRIYMAGALLGQDLQPRTLESTNILTRCRLRVVTDMPYLRDTDRRLL